MTLAEDKVDWEWAPVAPNDPVDQQACFGALLRDASIVASAPFERKAAASRGPGSRTIGATLAPGGEAGRRRVFAGAVECGRLARWRGQFLSCN